MSNKSDFNARQFLFLFKVSACFLGLVFGSFILAPKASMQRQTRPASNVAVVVNSNMMIGNYQPTPEPPKTIVRGRVFYADSGRAVKRASIMLMPGDASGGPGQSPSVLTDGNGNFVMNGVQAGTYYAIINAPGIYTPLAFFDFSVARNRGSDKEAFKDAFQGFEPIVVDGINETFVQIPARRGGAIGGRVVYDDGDAAIGVKVEVLRKVEDKFMTSIPNMSTIYSMRTGGGVFQTDDRGVYRFAGLPPGDYIVKVSENISHVENAGRRYYDPFEASFGGKSLLSIFYPDATDIKSAQIITVAPGQEISEVNLTLPSSSLYNAEGKIVSRKDKSPVNARISIKKSREEEVFSILDMMGGRQQQQASTDENGNFKFKELPKGTYTLTVEPINEDRDSDYSEYSNMNTMPRQPKNTPPKPKFAKRTYEITIEDKDLSDVIIELGYGATVSGTVTVENSKEMPTTVSVIAGQNEFEISSSDTIYNSPEKANPAEKNHDFKIENAVEGKTNFYVSINDDDFYVKSATFNGTDLLANPIELKEGDNLQNVQIVLSKAVGTLKATVLDSEKNPVKGAEFSLVPVDTTKRKNPSFFRSATTDENGEFEIKAPPFEYAIVFFSKNLPRMKGEELDKFLDDAVKNSAKVTIKTNETEKITLTMPK